MWNFAPCTLPGRMRNYPHCQMKMARYLDLCPYVCLHWVQLSLNNSPSRCTFASPISLSSFFVTASLNRLHCEMNFSLRRGKLSSTSSSGVILHPAGVNCAVIGTTLSLTALFCEYQINLTFFSVVISQTFPFVMASHFFSPLSPISIAYSRVKFAGKYDGNKTLWGKIKSEEEKKS
jgi:hypothetical protein